MALDTQDLAVLDKFSGLRVVCVGDAMLDRYVHGDVTRISPEAPIPVLRVDRDRSVLGGAGNVVNNLACLEGEVTFCSVTGVDEAAAEIAELLYHLGAGKGMVSDPARTTTVKTRFVSGTQQLLRVDRETASGISEALETRLLANVETAAANAHAIVISDYAKGLVTPRVARDVVALGNRHRLPVIVDSKMQDLRAWGGATLLKPNRRELAQATGLPVGTDAEIRTAALRLIESTGVLHVVVTRSEQGLSVVSADGGVIHLRTEAKEVFDVSGAGDTVAAVLGMALGCGATLMQAASLANHAAGVVVGKMGTAPIRLSELRNAVEGRREVYAHKLKSIDDAVDEAERWRARGVRVGFTNGCFDILHPGHISLLSEARRACDRLIVAINADASVKGLKGPERPVNNEQSRAAVLAALEDVDTVVIFGEATPLEILHKLRPDVLVKGADYTLDKVVGAEFVMSYGGRVILAELQQGHSTTATIGRMKG